MEQKGFKFLKKETIIKIKHMNNLDEQGKREKQKEFSIQMFSISILILVTLGLVFLVKLALGF